MKMKKEGRINSLDILRALSIFLVVIFHVLYEFTYLNSLRILGYVGVATFFILSGFLLANKYPNQKSFSIKWFAKRWISISVFYYLALILIILLFQKQTYSGSALKHFFYHAFFVDFINPDTAFSIISPAWFLIPLIGMYLLFPYLNRFISKNIFYLFILFIIADLYRLYNQTFTSYNPVFFLGEFCFGIAMAYHQETKAFAISLLSVIINPLMLIPYLLFFSIYSFNLKIIPSRISHFLGKHTISIFLYHEAFMKVCFDKWHIFGLSRYISLILLSISTLIAVFVSTKTHKIASSFIDK